jgi:hypothetical protein
MNRSSLCGLVATVALAACAAEKAPAPKSPALAIVEMRDGRLHAPDTVPAGTVRLRLVRPDSAGHNLVVFALAKDTDAESFAKALDLAPETPAPAVARGGPETPPEPGDTSDVYLTLAPGRYLFGCMLRGFAASRHVSAGEWRVVTVVPSEAESPPSATLELGLADFAFQSENRWPAGDQMIKVTNIGNQEHIAFISRLDPGRTLREWIAAEGDAPWSHSLGGVSRLGPGQSVLLPRTLAPGRYILTCLFIDPKSGRPHVELGMLREITVGTGT